MRPEPREGGSGRIDELQGRRTVIQAFRRPFSICKTNWQLTSPTSRRTGMPRPRTPTSPTMRPSWARFRRPAPSSASRRPRPAAARPESHTRPAGPKRGEIAFLKSTRSMSRRPDGAFACSMLRAVVFTDLLLPASLTDAKEIRFLNARYRRYRRYHEEEGGALFGFTQAEKPAPAEPGSADIARAEALVGGQVRAHRRNRPEPRGARGAQGRRSGPQGAPKGAGRIDADPPRDRRGARIGHPPPRP